MDRCLKLKHKMESVMAPYKGVLYEVVQKKALFHQTMFLYVFIINIHIMFHVLLVPLT